MPLLGMVPFQSTIFERKNTVKQTKRLNMAPKPNYEDEETEEEEEEEEVEEEVVAPSRKRGSRKAPKVCSSLTRYGSVVVY